MKTIRATFGDSSFVEVAGELVPLDYQHRLTPKREGLSPVAVRVNNAVRSLRESVRVNATLEPVWRDCKEGAAIYRRSLCFLMAAAAHDMFPQKRFLVGHSLGYGYYCTTEDKAGGTASLTDDELEMLKVRMHSLVKEDLPITPELFSYEEACSILERLGLDETRRLLDSRCPLEVTLNTMAGFASLYFGPLLSSSGALDVFDLTPCEGGFMLRFPRRTEPARLMVESESPKLFEIYRGFKKRGKLLGVTSAAALSQLVYEGKTDEFIDISETFQDKTISAVADQIQQRGTVKVVLIAGPSSSGKTTMSKKLALHLRALSYTPKVISLDSYYLSREKTPKDENGQYDYECLEALDVELLNENLLSLFSGKAVRLPSYDFSAGKSYFKGDEIALDEGDILVIEGIHGLNDKLTPLIPAKTKFKLYVSALTQLNLDDHNRVSTSDNRLIRRIVRDFRYRGKSAADTIAMWPSVRRGEKLHIFPFQDNADAMLNTALDYELPVLKVYAEPLLRCVPPTVREYAEADRLLEFLSFFPEVPASSVPQRSIIREFIGGSTFKY